MATQHSFGLQRTVSRQGYSRNYAVNKLQNLIVTGEVDVMRKLIEKGVDINAVNNKNHSALIIALDTGIIKFFPQNSSTKMLSIDQFFLFRK